MNSQREARCDLSKKLQNMNWKQNNKKTKKLSYAEQQELEKRLEATKAVRKTLRGYAILQRQGSKQDFKLSGTFKDENELRKTVDDFMHALCEVSGKEWTLLEVNALCNNSFDEV